MRAHVKRVSIWSAAKVGCLMTALPIICVASFLLLALINPALAFAPSLEMQLRLLGGGSSAVFVIIAYAFFAGIGTALVWGFTAIIYNVVAFLFGGVEISLERKQVEVRPPIYSQFDDPQQSQSPQRTAISAAQEVKAKGQPGVGLSTWYDLTSEEREMIRKKRG